MRTFFLPATLAGGSIIASCCDTERPPFAAFGEDHQFMHKSAVTARQLVNRLIWNREAFSVVTLNVNGLLGFHGSVRSAYVRLAHFGPFLSLASCLAVAGA